MMSDGPDTADLLAELEEARHLVEALRAENTELLVVARRQETLIRALARDVQRLEDNKR